MHYSTILETQKDTKRPILQHGAMFFIEKFGWLELDMYLVIAMLGSGTQLNHDFACVNSHLVLSVTIHHLFLTLVSLHQLLLNRSNCAFCCYFPVFHSTLLLQTSSHILSRSLATIVLRCSQTVNFLVAYF